MRSDWDAARGLRSLDTTCCPLQANGVRMAATRLPLARRNVIFTGHLACARDRLSLFAVAAHAMLQMMTHPSNHTKAKVDVDEEGKSLEHGRPRPCDGKRCSRLSSRT